MKNLILSLVLATLAQESMAAFNSDAIITMLQSNEFNSQCMDVFGQSTVIQSIVNMENEVPSIEEGHLVQKLRVNITELMYCEISVIGSKVRVDHVRNGKFLF
jgi:hypothetical protein